MYHSGVTTAPSENRSPEAPAGEDRSKESFSGGSGVSFDEEDWGRPLPYPMCGCCRQKVTIVREEGKPYTRNGKTRREYVEIVVFPCKCRELKRDAECFLCGRCSGCCRCPVPAMETK